ncbi:MAG: diguanylate cyclase [Lachnospiraceae bacterium]|nr:diguanylate cyclase [Lachnospiraceae bacterium]
MKIDQTAVNLIASSLAGHFESLYYTELNTGRFVQYYPSRKMEDVSFPDEGGDLFALIRENAAKFVHPADQAGLLKLYDREKLRRELAPGESCSVICRGLLNGKMSHLRHIVLMCEDGEHVLCCLENIDREYREKEEQKRNLQSAERMARTDELTGIKNKNAYAEKAAEINDMLSAGEKDCRFGIVMCDVNDLKVINDTRGHSFGDEAIQSVSSMICNIFVHSPVYRVGGDEFAVVLSGRDYEQRVQLLEMLRRESEANGRSRSGPMVACGLAVYDTERDSGIDSVYDRADRLMYENKSEMKNGKLMEGFRKMDAIEEPIPDERKRLLDGLFGALYTVAGEGYVYLNDMRYDFSRWSLPLICDFDMKSQYMYHAGKIWQEYIHPDDLKAYTEAVEAVFNGSAEIRPIYYRARRRDGSYMLLTTRGFVLSDEKGDPEYFGGIIIPQG